MPEEITKVQLSNGLTVQLKEIHTAPIISYWIWYRVGSRDELQGKTGISHWVEHMQFKGTPAFPAGVLDRAISRDGGFWNAFTYLDWTAYFETSPAEKINLGLRLEADRMVNSLYETQEVESERTVIISEREGNENEPLFRLDEAVQQAAFDNHPYRHEIIGYMQDLRQITRDDLFEHYIDYYKPNNALVAVAGDFDTHEMLERIRELYGEIPGGLSPRHTLQPEACFNSERRIQVNGPGETTFLEVAYRAPSAAQADFFPLMVADSLLSGPTSLNMFGGGGLSNKTSRLYRALVERELAINVVGGLQATIDPFLYSINSTVRSDRTAQEVLAAIDVEIRRLQETLVSSDEIARAIKQARALFVYSSENITNQAFWLGYAEMFASYEWFAGYMDRLEKVTPEDVQRVSQTIFNPDHRVVGIYLPCDNEKGGEG